MYPERLQRVVIYNLPLVVTWIAYLVLSFVDKVTRDKVVLFHGSDSKKAPCPDDLKNHVAHRGLVPPHAHHRHAALPNAPALPDAPPPPPPSADAPPAPPAR